MLLSQLSYSCHQILGLDGSSLPVGIRFPSCPDQTKRKDVPCLLPFLTLKCSVIASACTGLDDDDDNDGEDDDGEYDNDGEEDDDAASLT